MQWQRINMPAPYHTGAELMQVVKHVVFKHILVSQRANDHFLQHERKARARSQVIVHRVVHQCQDALSPLRALCRRAGLVVALQCLLQAVGNRFVALHHLVTRIHF